MMSKEAIKIALEALESCGWNDGYAGENQYFHDDLVDKAITALREALAEQPAQQEPVEKIISNLEPLLAAKNQSWTYAENMLLELLATAPQPAQQEPIYQHKLANGSWIDQTKESYDYNVRHGHATVRVVYSSPPAQRKPLTDEWVPVTEKLLNKQHPWLYQPMWIAMKGGVVVQGYYAWRQGRNPDRFITDLGDEWVFNADFVMPITKPTPPAIEAAYGIKENT